MLNKTFEELRKVDVSQYTKQRDGIDYLPWVSCIDLLHEQGAEKVSFNPVINEKTGNSLFMSDIEFVDKNGMKNRCYEIEVEFEIDDKKYRMRSPLMNGANPVKDNSMSQQRVWNAQTRAFVKGVAIYTGLGWNLWSRNDVEDVYDDDLSKHSLDKIKQRFQEEYTVLLQKKMSSEDIAVGMQMTVDEVKAVFAQFDTLKRFEDRLVKLKNDTNKR